MKANSIPMVITITFLIFSVTTAAQPPAGKSDSIKECVNLLLGPNPEAGPISKWRPILCKDLLRTTAKSFKITGNLPPEYLRTLEELPAFKNNPAKLRTYLCGLGLTKKAAEKFGCSKKIVIERN
ncbi:MA3 domain-containing protein [Striga asiatica]|uniref:MA3 domain-containing protein n=1 Tax=Striga asiatica TaxID=4170 RepID=A0A5A7PTJ5_STRAF|nr:MA3 domain-containing protein [Striga asiatica]